jgi:hypothetical protein
VELVRVPDADEQRAIATAILEESLQTAEVRQVAQIRRRSRQPLEDCLREVIGLRPTVERRYVFIGAVGDADVQARLADLTQAQRNALLLLGLEALGLPGTSGRLGEKLITLVGDERLNSEIKRQGGETIEARLGAHIAENISNVQRES